MKTPARDEFRVTGNEDRARGSFLAPCGRRSDEYGFVEDPRLAMRDEPEALSDEQHKLHIAEGAMYRDRQLKQVQLTQIQQARSCLTLEQRILEIQRVAKMRHIHVKGEVESLKYDLGRARAGGRKDPSTVIWKVERLEARLDAKYLPDAA